MWSKTVLRTLTSTVPNDPTKSSLNILRFTVVLLLTFLKKLFLFLFLPPIFPFCIVLHVHQTRSAVDQNCRLELCDVFLVRARVYHLLLNIFSCAVNIEKLAGTVLGKCRPSVFFAPTSLC